MGAAVASARRFDLSVLVGQSANSHHAKPPTDAETVSIGWRDDFAAARNELAAIARTRQAGHPYLLWLDSDEEIMSWPAHDWRQESAPWLLVQIQDSAAMTPRPSARLQRNNDSLRWCFAIHEMLEPTAPERPPPPAPLPGLLLSHHGYEDDAVIAAKIKRNHAIVAAERRSGRDYLYLWVEEARYAEAFGKGAAKAWSKVFNHPDAAPRGPGDIDLRVEAAEALCAFGNSAPAEELLAGNLHILSLHLAILRGQSARGETIDAERLGFLARAAEAGSGDWRHSYPRAILGATRDEIRALATQPSEPAHSAGAVEQANWESGMQSRFMQNEGFDAEILGEDLVLMNNKTQEVLTLNPTARAVWEALDGGPSVAEIAEAFEEIFPDIDKAELRADIIRTIDHFVTSGLAVKTEDAA